MEPSTTSSRVTNSRVAWLLLVTYVILLGVSGCGIWAALNNFWVDEAPAPTPPIKNTTNTTTTTVTPDLHGYYWNSGREQRNEYEIAYDNYMGLASEYASAGNDARLYVAVPCLTSCVVAVGMVVAALCSRKVFTTTYSLYSCVGLWGLTLAVAIKYQDQMAWNSRYFSYSVSWVVGFHCGLLLLLLLQVLLAVWELRRQKAEWPTFNLLFIFTLETALVAARLTLSIYTTCALLDSRITYGMRLDGTGPYERRPMVRYPPLLTATCYAAASYGLVATAETAVSTVLGSVHRHLTTLSCMMSAVCFGTIAVLSSPVFVRMMVGTSIYMRVMAFAIPTSIVTFLHLLCCMCFPVASRSTIGVIKDVVDALKSGSKVSSESVVQGLTTLGKKIPKETIARSNLPSVVFSVISLIIGFCINYHQWGIVLLMCVNAATLARTLPAVIMKHAYNLDENVSEKLKFAILGVENFGMLLGSSVVFSRNYSALHNFLGVANFTFFVYQAFIMVFLVRVHTVSSSPEEIRPLAEADDGPDPDEDDRQNLTEAMA